MSRGGAEVFLSKPEGQGAMLSLFLLLLVPSIITGLQVSMSKVQSQLSQYPATIISFSVIFYVIMVILAGYHARWNVQPLYVIMLMFLYLLWSTLLFSLGQILWSYIILIIILILYIVMFKSAVIAMKSHGHHGLFLLYFISFCWLFGLFLWMTISWFLNK